MIGSGKQGIDESGGSVTESKSRERGIVIGGTQTVLWAGKLGENCLVLVSLYVRLVLRSF